MKNTITIVLSTVIIFALMIGCSSNKSQVNKFLDSYENIVVKWEEKGNDGSFSEKELDELDKIMEKTTAEAQDLQQVTKWTPKQQQRYGELTERLMKSIFNSVNIFK